MTKDILEARIKELSQTISESSDAFQKLKSQLDIMVNNHNSMVGRLEEAKEMYQKMSQSESPVTVDVLPLGQ